MFVPLTVFIVVHTYSPIELHDAPEARRIDR